jgi:hypothetical protein
LLIIIFKIDSQNLFELHFRIILWQRFFDSRDPIDVGDICDAIPEHLWFNCAGVDDNKCMGSKPPQDFDIFYDCNIGAWHTNAIGRYVFCEYSQKPICGRH